MTAQQRVSIVIPVYNEQDTLPELFARLQAVVTDQSEYDWELLFVNDGSLDASGGILSRRASEMQASDTLGVSVIHLSRNFGHQVAISAGIDLAQGDAVIVMDGDLQDPPEVIPDMLAQWREGYHVVYATRRARPGDTPFKRASASLFYRLLSRLAAIEIPLDTGDFRLMSREVVNALSVMRERNRFIRGLVSWIGYPQTAVYYSRERRRHGETKFSLWQMARFAIDGIVSFSTVPLQWITTLGFAISVMSFAASLWVLYLRFFQPELVVLGWSSTLLGILLLGGIQLVCVGMVGEYVGRIYDEVRRRPLYLIEKIEGKSSSVSFSSKYPCNKEVVLYEQQRHPHTR